MSHIPAGLAPGQPKPSIEDLQSMILDRLNQLESTHAPTSTESAQPPSAAAAASTSSNVPAAPESNVSDLQARLDAIFNNSELTNQQKVEDMYRFYT